MIDAVKRFGDEAYIGSLERNKHKDRMLNASCGATSMTAVIGLMNRESNKVKVLESTRRRTLHGFINVRLESRVQCLNGRFSELRVNDKVQTRHFETQYRTVCGHSLSNLTCPN